MKSKYETIVLPKLMLIQSWAMEGVSEKQIAENLNIAYSTFRKYRDNHEALSAVLTRGKDVADAEVKNALFKKAQGYNAKFIRHYKLKRIEYDKVTGKKLLEEEHLVEAEDEVHVPADVTAQMFWLANRCRDKWKYKPEAPEDDDEESGVVVLPPVMEAPEPPGGDGDE